jgi:VanZ family protein
MLRGVVARPWRVLLLVGWMALITFWSGQGNLPIDQPTVATPLHGLQHKLAHLVAFGLMALLARWAFDGHARAVWLAIALTSLFGVFDEWHQSFTPGRRAAWDDWLLDTLAAAFALYVRARLVRTSWRAPLRRLAPLVVAGVFGLAIVLALRPHVSTAQMTSAARDVAHQIRARAAG